MQPGEDRLRDAGRRDQPNQPCVVMSTPCSRRVGTSGKAGSRSAPLQASARIRPARTSSATEETDWNSTCTRPSIRSVFIWLDCE